MSESRTRRAAARGVLGIFFAVLGAGFVLDGNWWWGGGIVMGIGGWLLATCASVDSLS
jgi:hypothetical protein